MLYQILISENAALDLKDIYRYIKQVDGTNRAKHVIGQIKISLKSLSKNPQRGTYPNEMLDFGIREFREVFFKPYRIIYRVIDKQVYVILIADGRRDMNTLFQQRLFQT